MIQHNFKLILTFIFSINIFLFSNFEKDFQTQLILVETGGIIQIPSGNFKIKGTLSIEGKNNITIEG